MKKSWQGSNFCVLCARDEEPVDHLFLCCSFSRSVWEKLAQCLRIHIPQLPPTSKKFGHLGDIRPSIKTKGLFEACSDCCFLGIQRERNNRIFNESAISSQNFSYLLVGHFLLAESPLRYFQEEAETCSREGKYGEGLRQPFRRDSRGRGHRR